MKKPGQIALTVTPCGAQSAAVAAGEMDHRGLRRFVSAAADAAVDDQARHRGDVDDPPAPAAGQHRSADDLGAQKGAGQIQPQDFLPLFQRQVDRSEG